MTDVECNVIKLWMENDFEEMTNNYKIEKVELKREKWGKVEKVDKSNKGKKELWREKKKDGKKDREKERKEKTEAKREQVSM